MSVYRISKYNPAYRDGEKYIREEWTDYSDIGLSFSGEVLTKKEYLRVEQNYISCIIAILRLVGAQHLVVKNLENYEDTAWLSDQIIPVEHLSKILCDCLRNRCWCRLESNEMYIHFGYDYYVYISVDLPKDKVVMACKEFGLFCDEWVHKDFVQ